MKHSVKLLVIGFLLNLFSTKANASDERLNGEWVVDSLTCQSGNAASSTAVANGKSKVVTIKNSEYKSVYTGKNCTMTLKGKLGTQGNVITIKEHFRIFQGSCKYKNGNKIPDGKEEQLEDATRFYSFENGQLITFDHASADTTCPKNDTIVTHYNKSKGASASAEGRSEDNGGSR